MGLRRWEKVSLKQLDQGIKVCVCVCVCGGGGEEPFLFLFSPLSFSPPLLSPLLPPQLSHCSWVKCGNQFNLSAVPYFYKWLLWLMTDVVIETIKVNPATSSPVTLGYILPKHCKLLPNFLGHLVHFERSTVISIQAFFYVTEHSNHHNHVFYYRKPVWAKLCKMVLEGIFIYVVCMYVCM